MTRLAWTPQGWEDYLHWQATDKTTLKRINELLRDAMRQPFVGLGKPEPLKGDLSGWWSRRITAEHRLVYRIEGNGDSRVMVVAMCRYHY